MPGDNRCGFDLAEGQKGQLYNCGPPDVYVLREVARFVRGSDKSDRGSCLPTGNEKEQVHHFNYVLSACEVVPDNAGR